MKLIEYDIYHITKDHYAILKESLIEEIQFKNRKASR